MSRNFTAQYRAAADAARNADTISERGMASHEAELIATAADNAGQPVNLAAVHADIEPTLTRKRVYVGLNGAGIPVYDTVWA